MLRAVAFVAAAAVVSVVGVSGSRPASAATDEQLARYVSSVYADLFDRAPDPTGAAGWLLALRTGGPRVAVANAITSSHEFRSRLITDTYLKFLGRGPDPQGLQNWLTAMDLGATISQISSGFIASDEYYAHNGGQPVPWVSAMYRDVLGRTAGPGEAADWAAGLLQGRASRTSISMGILLSAEHLTPVVEGYYQKLLKRSLDPTGQRNWIALLQAGTHDEDIIGGIVASDEYWALAVRPVPTGIALAGAAQAVAGTHVPFTVTLVADGTGLRDVTTETVLAISAGGTCAASACWATAAGDYTVTGSWKGFTTSAVLHVTHGPAVSGSIAVAGLAAPNGGNIPAGASTAVTVTATDAGGNHWDATADFTVKLDGTPCATVCGPFGAGNHTVTAVPATGSVPVAPVTVVGKNPTAPGSRLFSWDVDGDGNATGPVQVGTGTWWTSLAASDYTASARRSDGSTWSWTGDAGSAPSWTAGTGTSQTASSIFDLQTGRFAEFTPGGLKGWGSNENGEMGTGSADAVVREPTPVAGAAGKTWKTVVGDDGFTLGLTGDGELWAWGDNGYGTFGAPSAPSSRVPVRIGTDHWKSVATGWWTSVGVRSDGTLWQWGLGLDGARLSGPQQIGTATTWESVVASNWDFAALTTTKELWTWYGSAWAEPEDVAPHLVPAPATWNKVAVAFAQWSGIASDGSLWTGDTRGWAAPIRLGTDVGWVDVEAWDKGVLALRP
ncbi:DUF4214 domain-containing protein [Cellulomonas sp. URHE0023]|uniref:DUF4214 domain-containing protein n=1 Tax=Cellulomonas sp. URHE0023 TaxID=1380354 RepID=UPI00048721B3|nr:DUF4214 domain-containing protein [Cellulomonas sp. URHE0023]